MKLSFRGGIRIDEHKNTEGCAIRRLPAPAKVAIPLSQHIGVQCRPTVGVGDRVLRGQQIGELPGGLGCPVHSSVSGVVRELRVRHNSVGAPITDVVIENDGSDRLAPEIYPQERSTETLTPEEITEAVYRAGISGMGGAAFPTHAKIGSAAGHVDTLLINCAECEPYITANHRLLLEDAASVLRGTRLLMRAVGVQTGTLVVEDNKADAIAHLRELCASDYPDLRVAEVRTKYPQGDERQLIYAVTRRALPAGKLPADIGCVVFNAETAAAVFRAAALGMPLIERIVTVDGDCIREPGNLLVPIGTSFRDLIAACGGLKREPARLISGGPMMGQALWSVDEPVTKGTSAVLALSEPARPTPVSAQTCIRCGRCVAACPMHLMPNYMASLARTGDYAGSAEYGTLSCVECGCCSYVCPAGIPLVQYIRAAKAVLRQKPKKEG